MASRGKYSAIVLDIDGTMVGPDRVIPERLKVAAMAAERAGAVVLIATGRMLSSSLHFAGNWEPEARSSATRER